MANVYLVTFSRKNRSSILFMITLVILEVINIVRRYHDFKNVNTIFYSYRSDTKWKNLPYYKTNFYKVFTIRYPNNFSIYRPIDAFQIVRRNGFGNNLFGILHSLSVAQDLNITDIYVNSTEYWWINMNEKIDRFRFLEAPAPPELNVIRDDFFRIYPGYPVRRTKYQYLFAPHIKSKFEPIDIPNDTLVMHIRSGDIYSTNIQPAYAQPPLCYYKSIINKYKWKRVMILAQDMQNPVIPELIKMGAEFYNFSLKKTIQHVYYAKTLVIGFGTFGFGVLRICDQPKVVYEYAERDQWYFGYQENGIEFNKTFKIFINARTEEYNTKMYPWKRTSEQITLQLHSKCDPRWYKVTDGSLVPYGII